MQGLGYCGGAEGKTPSSMRFASERVNAASGVGDPTNLSDAYLYRESDHDQDGMHMEVPKTFSFIFPKEDGI